MYNTVKEMHIALDVGLQHINSNRKQSISVDYKDMALNYAVLQFIETRTSEKSNRKGEGLEDTTKRYDDLRDLKRSHKAKTYKSDDKVFSILPPDYYKLISAGAKVKFSKFDLPKAINNEVVHYRILPFPDDNSSGSTYKNLTIRRAKGDAINQGTIIFDAIKHINLPDLYNRDSKFILINLILEVVNNLDGYNVFWETWNNQYYKDCFIIVTTHNQHHYLNYDNIDVQGYSSVSSMSRNYLRSTYNHFEYNYYNSDGVIRDADLVSSEDEFRIVDNHYHNKNKHRNPSAYLDAGTIYLQEGDNFVITETNLVYYKKPRLISYRHNQSCEIKVNREIIDLAVQRLKAYIKDEGYQHVVNENQIIE